MLEKEDMQSRNRLITLYDLYGSLLTEKQRGIFDHYYQEDWSLMEIAELTQTSRQAVHHSLQRTEALLNHYEKELGVLKNAQDTDAILNTIIQQLTLSLETDEWPRKTYEDLLAQCIKERGDANGF